MCGICGIYNLDGRPVDAHLLRRMNNTLVHRGPDAEGYYINGNVGLGHRRLSIIDLEGGKQPMGNRDASIQVVFNGEIYNFLELKQSLEARGYHFRTRSDTETILYSYEEWGEGFVEKLRGMFAIALWDGRQKKLLLVRDRVGKKPLYYHLNQDRILFASELKALLEDSSIPKDIDLRALDAYLSFGYVPSPLSIFQAIRKIPPANVAVQNAAGFSIKEYWRLDMETEASQRPEQEVFDELKSIFDETVRLRLVSDVSLGAFLSGGVDSSAVVASMARSTDGTPVKTASIGFLEKEFDELEYARIVAKKYHTDHSEFVVNPDALEVLDKIVWHLDEPFADASAIPTYFVCKMARQKVTVALSGDGGDETFAGYIQRYHMNRLEDKIRKMIPAFFRENILGPVANVYPRVDSLPRPFRLKRFLSNLSLEFEEAFFHDMSFYFLPEMKQELYRHDVIEAIKDVNSFDVLGEHFKRNKNPDVVTRVQYVDIKTYLPEDILVKVDRMSMAHSLEVRSPLLDHRLMEYMGSLPSNLKLRGQQSKYILKRIMEDRLPDDILYRGKQGFCVPLSKWLRGDLKEFARETLFSSNSRHNSSYFNMAYVKDLWRQHQRGWKDYSLPLWGLMMFELWQRKFT